MTYNPTSIGRTLAAGACALVLGSACILGAVAPAQASAETVALTKAQWTRVVEQRLQVRPNSTIPDFIRNTKIAVVGAHFDANGVFTNVTMEQPTGIKLLDREAIRATRTLAYPILPASMRGMPRVVAMRVLFGDRIDPSALARTDHVANQLAGKYARTGTEIAAR